MTPEHDTHLLLGQAPNRSFLPQNVNARLIIVMVGLPARGKSYIVKKLARYLNWLDYTTRIFNAGQRRRVAATSQTGPPGDVSSAAFFNPRNPDGVALRDKIALGTLQELLEWLARDDARVGIFDATNTTIERRRLLISHIRTHTSPAPEVLFLESYTFDQTILQNNIQLKLLGPDYCNQERSYAIKDLIQRLTNYERAYVPLGAFEEIHGLPYVSMIDVGRKIGTHLVHGYLSTQIVEYLLNFNLAERQIWITCNGESSDDRMGKIGRNAGLTDHGRAYAIALEHFITAKREAWEQSHRKKVDTTLLEDIPGTLSLPRVESQGRCSQTNGHTLQPPTASSVTGTTPDSTQNCSSNSTPFDIWTSTMPQCIQTSSSFSSSDYSISHLKMLDDLNAGDMAGLTFHEIQNLHPAVSGARQRSPLLYRWPGLGGESYIDAINRLRGVILELERIKHHVMLITHRAIVRALLGYFLGIDSSRLADLRLSKDSVFCIEPVSLLFFLGF